MKNIKRIDNKKYIIGIMSGTSMDGADACLLEVNKKHFSIPAKNSLVSLKIPDELKNEFRALTIGGENEIHRAQIAGINLSNLYAKAVAKLLQINNLSSQDILVIGAHGQTIRHQPNFKIANKKFGYSVQLLNGNYLAEATNIPVVFDFRARDLASGGQGAPLIPAFHRAIYQQLILQKKVTINESLGFLNIGGMANITICNPQKTIGCDTGPGNCLMDVWININHQKAFDKDGNFAKSGKVNFELFDKLYQHQFFKQKPPKSCGAEEFNLEFINSAIKFINSKKQAKINPADVQATLCLLTATSTVDTIKQLCNAKVQLKKLIVFGGGINNKTLIAQIKNQLPNYQIMNSNEIGIPAQAMESVAFAWLAWQKLLGNNSNVPEVTGAVGGRSLGVVV